MSPKDPFIFKQHSKLHPRRLIFTAWARLAESAAKRRFASFKIPELAPSEVTPTGGVYDEDSTAVTSSQMDVLVHGLKCTEDVPGPAVEIGAYRGVTTFILASRTQRDYVAVDPYIGYGGAESDCQMMKQRVSQLKNVRHLRMTSGEAARLGHVEQISFVFVDAVHDYVNARFDGFTWGNKLSLGGLIAFHDTDSIGFAGVQRAVWEMLNHKSRYWSLFAHVNGLVVLKRERVNPGAKAVP